MFGTIEEIWMLCLAGGLIVKVFSFLFHPSPLAFNGVGLVTRDGNA
jgi:hypothetical protein